MAGRSRFLDGAGRAGAPLWVVRLFPLLLFALSLAPRLVAIGRYVTPDEAIWAYRSIQFREAILEGHWSETLVAGHPGVTTTWLGTIGITAQLQLSPGTREAYDWLTTMAHLTPDNVEAFERLAVFLTGGRVAVALVNSLGVVGVYFLIRRLWGYRVAIIAGLFLALDPFLVGLSGLLHVDGLSATFATLSLLALAMGLQPNMIRKKSSRSWSWLALAGAAAGLAVLSKTPTLLLLPVSGLAMLWPITRNRSLPLRDKMRSFLSDGLIWGAAFLATVIILYPALWVSPAAVLATVGGSANRHLDEALRETFFLGRAAFDHGPLFYPVVLLWRLSPVVWLALIPAVWLLIRERRNTRSWPKPRLSVMLLAAWAVLFLMAITPAAKKFDRYILPAVPVLLLLAAIAWASWSRRDPRFGRLLPLVLLGQALFWLAYATYPLTAYNPLVGGPRTAVQVLPIGWGEGISAAGRWLSQSRPDAVNERAIAGVASSLAPFFSGRTLVDGVDDPATANYTIVTLGGRQLDPVGFEDQIEDLELIHTEHFGGLDQSWVYEQPSPRPPETAPELSEPVIFGDRMALTAYGQAVEGDAVRMTAQWRRLAQGADDERYTLRLAITDDTGNVWAAQETDLLNEVYFYPPNWETDDTGLVRYLLELPPGIPPATYHVVLSLIDNRTAGQLPVRVGEGDFQGVAYNAGAIDVPPPESIVSASRIRIPSFSLATWLDGTLRLLGYGEILAEALAGSELPIDLFWHVPQGSLPPGLRVAWSLRAVDGAEDIIVSTEPLSRYDTGLWRTGETIQEKYRVPLPPDLPAGRYELSVGPLLSDGEPAGLPHTLAELQINNIDRVYELPESIPVLMDVGFGALTLLGMEPGTLLGAPGESAEMTLYWEKAGQFGEVYNVFVHVLNEDDEIVLQADHWPGGLPTNILDAGQVVTDRVPLPLPADLPPGEYRVRVGLYSAESGRRLPVIDSGAIPSELSGPEYVILPVTLQVVSPDA